MSLALRPGRIPPGGCHPKNAPLTIPPPCGEERCLRRTRPEDMLHAPPALQSPTLPGKFPVPSQVNGFRGQCETTCIIQVTRPLAQVLSVNHFDKDLTDRNADCAARNLTHFVPR